MDIEMRIKPLTNIRDKEAHREIDGLGKFGIKLVFQSNNQRSKNQILYFVNQLLLRISEKCFAQGADLIGHIKIHLETSAGHIGASLVQFNEEANIIGDIDEINDIKIIKLTLNVIVHGIWDSAVAEESKIAIEEVCTEINLGFKYEK
jgi:hypothetical protein|tara:strand:- start:1039 stop:1482 length:444 start_codon:yes stop_codon:yes gene_type:complete